MFRVRHKTTGLKYTVYAVEGLKFLIWDDSTYGFEHWEWEYMTEFEQYKEVLP